LEKTRIPDFAPHNSCGETSGLPRFWTWFRTADDDLPAEEC
jgi:hypothetical protein